MTDLASAERSGPGRPLGGCPVGGCPPRPKRASWGILAAVAAALMLAACSETNPSHVRVIDGDTIVLTNTNTHVRLNGVDAPEVVHPGYARADDFGPEAREEMRRIIGDAVVRRELNGERSYERLVGVCFLPDGTDTGAEIIRRGLALDCARWRLTSPVALLRYRERHHDVQVT